jgi:hypothetical protein
MIVKLGMQSIYSTEYNIQLAEYDEIFQQAAWFLIISTQLITETRKENPSMPDNRQARVTCIKAYEDLHVTENSGQPRSLSALDRLTGQDLPCANQSPKCIA